MSDPESPPHLPAADPPQTPLEGATSPGPNLTLLYSLIVLALVAAIGFAILIVLPFYHRR